MIDEKKIEEAALKHSADSWLSDDCRTAFEDGFSEGINWFLGNLWHDAREEPKKDKDLLVERIYHNEKSVATDRANTLYDSWETKVNREEITRWLYIDDLMKGGK